MHDFAALEARGVVAAFCASTEFVDASAAQARALGYREVPAVFVPHPIQDRTDDETRALADAALDAVLAAVTTGGPAR
ncbi:hypothetical protein GCM10010210_19920 [Pseudonocardia hydrocarbonoxydans]|uniref:UGSC-like domain-containing protein n=1 Tax=Pseudonocardia hydrocarbonoxydans TaxID=76726 RepID=A0A4Y3WNH4_9PSEU|nr:hypothetical protein PHY01_20740 [Pseudonocardia hydrocarbonoxydans]